MGSLKAAFKFGVFRLPVFFLFFHFVLPSAWCADRIFPLHPLSPEKEAYFSSLYQETWNYLSAYVEKNTGLPYDSSARQPPTSMTNVGLYLASTAVAYRTGLISREDALERIGLAYASLQKVPKWRGFPRPWVIARTLKPTFGDEFSYGSHLASLLGGLIVVKTTFPEFSKEIERMFLSMDFKSLYDPYHGWLKGGYNVKTQNFAIFQPWGRWYYKHLASETRLLSFYLIARGLVPEDHWAALVRPVQGGEKEVFLGSGYEDGGIFPQYFGGIFIDERETEMGRSQKNYARYQMKRARELGAPVWGWSPSLTPRGKYLTAGELRSEIIAPYASLMASIYFPNRVYENLKKAEELGTRPQAGPEGTPFGFRDSVNWKTGEVSKHSMTLSQAAGFLSLANLLYNGIVWQSFAEDAVVQRGFETLDWVPQVELAPSPIPEGSFRFERRASL